MNAPVSTARLWAVRTEPLVPTRPDLTVATARPVGSVSTALSDPMAVLVAPANRSVVTVSASANRDKVEATLASVNRFVHKYQNLKH